MGAPAPDESPRAPNDDDAEAILDLHRQGLSQGETARRLNLKRPDLSRWSKRHGVLWNAAPQAATTQIARMTLQRAALAEQALADAVHLRMRMWEQATEVHATRDGVETVVLDLPSARSVADFASAVERLARIADHNVADVGVSEARSMLGRLWDAISTQEGAA